jgi:hypothetical protein
MGRDKHGSSPGDDRENGAKNRLRAPTSDEYLQLMVATGEIFAMYDREEYSSRGKPEVERTF